MAELGDFLFELQWWHGAKFIQRFHAWEVGGHAIWERAMILFELQQAHKALRAARRRGPSVTSEGERHG